MPRSRGCRAGRKKQQQRHKKAELTANQLVQIAHPIIRSDAGDAPRPLSITLLPLGREVAASDGTATTAAPPRAIESPRLSRRSLLPCDELELVGVVYDAARLQMIGQITVFGRPETGRITMGNRHMNGMLTNVTYLQPWDSLDAVPPEQIHNAHAFATVIDIHRRVPGGTLWFDRSSATWEQEMEFSRQPGAIVYPGRLRVRVIFDRPQPY